MKLNKQKFHALTNEQFLQVFRRGFEVLGKDSPFETTHKKIIVGFSTDAVWCVPEGGTKHDTLCALQTQFGFDETANYLQFDADRRKFDELAAIQELINLGAIEVA